MRTNAFKMPDRSNKAIAGAIRANVAHRQQLKKKWDRHCKYNALPENMSASDALELTGNPVECDFSADTSHDNWVRLLDEGVVVDGVDDVFAVIKKGVLKKAFNAMPDDFEGNIDKDHNRSIELGTFTKKDLKLVKLDNDRFGIDVNVKLDDELYAVRDLKRIGRKCAISSEFFSVENEFVKKSKITGQKEEFDYLVPLIEEVQLTGYAVCDSPKNANSYNEELLKKASTQKGLDMDPEELKKQEAEAAAAAAEAEAETAEDMSADAADAEANDNAEEGSEEGTQNDASAEEPADTEEGEGEDSDEEETSDEDADIAEKFEVAINELREKNAAFEATIAEKDAKIAELEAKLTAKTEQKNAFRAKLEKVLDFATVETPEDLAAGEGEKTPEDKDSDEVMSEYQAAFANLK